MLRIGIRRVFWLLAGLAACFAGPAGPGDRGALARPTAPWQGLRPSRGTLPWPAVAAAWAEEGPAASGGGVEVINDATTCRFYAVYRPTGGTILKATEPVRGRWVRWGDELEAPLPEADWTRADFDDSGWPRRTGPVFGGYGTGRRSGAVLACVRQRFGVADPARVTDLRLSLTYRGGVVVYVNGREVARGHLAKGAIDPLTPAAEYPREAFVTPDGEATLPNLSGRDPPPELLDRFNARLRSLEAAIPGEALRQGTNVLALEIHRAPVPADLPGRGETWETAGLVSVRLTAAAGSAVQANVDPPKGVQVWVAEPCLRPGIDADYGDPFEPLGPVQMVAPANGLAWGQVVVTAPAVIKGVTASVSDLKAADGAAIASSAVRVRYAKVSEAYVALLDEPPADDDSQRPPYRPAKRGQEERPAEGPRFLPVWLTVKVPPATPAGTYIGELRIRGLARPVSVPLALRVYGWRIGDPREWKTCVNLLQSPESVAGYYGVPLWSDEHFRLMEKSFALMAEAGNDVLGVSAVGKTVFGNDPLIVFRRESDRLVPDLKFLGRYLDLYARHAGEPMFLSVQVWHYGMWARGAGRDGGTEEARAASIPIVECQGDRLVPAEMPNFGPDVEPTWKLVMDGLKAEMARLGWRRCRLLVGTSGDCWADPACVAVLRKVAPEVQWRAITHGSGVPEWGLTDEERTQPNGMVVGYLELARPLASTRLRMPEHPITTNARDSTGPDPFCYRSLPVCSVVNANFDGPSWKGLDYWTYTTPAGTQRSALNADVRFGNIVGQTPRTLAMPGPDGAVATQQFEALRAGIQDTEAIFFIREALADPERRRKLGDDLAGRCEAVVEDTACMLETGLRFSPQGGRDLRTMSARLFGVAEEVARALQ